MGSYPVRSGIQETVRNMVVLTRCKNIFNDQGLNFDNSEMSNIKQGMKKMMTNVYNKCEHKTVLTPVKSGQCPVYQGFKQMPLGCSGLWENFIKIFCNQNKLLAGLSGIGVLVAGFRRIRALLARSSFIQKQRLGMTIA